LKFAINFFLLLFFTLLANAVTDDDWKLEKNENGISVFTRTGVGSDFKELKAVTNLNASLSSIVALIKDIPSHTSWIYQCKEARIIKTVNDSEFYYYHETYAPWPVANRYSIIYIKITQDSKTKVVTVASNNTPDVVPDEGGKVKVPKLLATWKFTPLADGTVDGEYQLFVDPGGEVPAWISNMFAVDGPYNSILGMKKMLMLDKYKLAKVDFITN
jgi:hypothetical protein